MNTLSREQQVAVVRALVEGNSLRSVARMTGVARNTISNLLRDLGAHCKNHHDRFVREVTPKLVQVDEIWSFVGMKEKNAAKQPERAQGSGDCWTWVGIDADSKLVIAYRVGDRLAHTAHMFMQDLHSRLAARVQLTTDGFQVYLRAVERYFGWNGCDYAQLVKVYGGSNEGSKGRYSPARLLRAEKQVVMGRPDPKQVSTSFVERQNLTMRMQMRRFTRLTNAFSKKAEYHLYAVALHYAYYNWCRPHASLNKQYGRPTTPAMAARLAEKPWSIEDLLGLLDGR